MRVIYDDVVALDGRKSRKNAFDNDVDRYEVFFDDECPMCGYGMDMQREQHYRYHDYTGDNNQIECKVACVHFCPHCRNLFVSVHEMVKGPNLFREIRHHIYPYSDKTVNLPDEIKRISTGFGIIYEQAIKAKNCELDEIYGMALRKALEHLVKDYALYKNPEKEDDIAKKSLAECIKNYIDDNRINTLCTSCRLIGNNETHWKNNNTAEDIIFMEKVLKAIIHYVEQEMIVEDAEKYNTESK